jgi:hypothetical protein
MRCRPFVAASSLRRVYCLNRHRELWLGRPERVIRDRLGPCRACAVTEGLVAILTIQHQGRLASAGIQIVSREATR